MITEQTNDEELEEKLSDLRKKIKKEEMKKWKILKRILITFIILFILGISSVLFLFYGPINTFKDWWITSAMTTMNHQYLAKWFYSDETINEVLSRNKVVEVDEITNPDLIIDTSNYNNEYERAILEKDPKHSEYKLINIKGDTYSGYLAVVYDPSKLTTILSKNVGTSGQYLVKIAQDNNAVLAINGGGFQDPEHSSTGGIPLGTTISKGKTITSYDYSGTGGLIGFDEKDNLILGKINIAKAKEMKIRDAVTCGPFLIVNGKASEVLGNGGWGDAPRTAIGQRADGIVLLLVLDGRRVGMQGADMNDLIKIMKNYGAVNAANLDGGTSSAIVVEGELINDPIDSTGAHKTRPIPTGFGLIL